MAKEPLTADEISFIEHVRDAAGAGMLYDVLRIDAGASREQIDDAYREHVRRWHPDKFYARDQGLHAIQIQDNFVEFTKAWKTLRNDQQRSEYDRELINSGRMPTPQSTVNSSISSVVTQVDVPSSFEVLVNRVGGAMRVEPSSATRVEPPRSRAPAAVEKIRQQLTAQFAQAKTYFEAGKAEALAGSWGKAESAFYLATRYDPKNPEYETAHREAAVKARQGRAVHHLALAEQAESYAKHKEAIEHLKKAVDCDPPEGVAWFRLGRLLKDYEDDTRGALEMYRRAVLKNPKNQVWRLALAELYESLGMRQNAQRETRAVIEAEPKNELAKALLKRLG